MQAAKKYVTFDVFTAVTTRKAFSGMLRRLLLVGTDVSGEYFAPIIKLTIIGELGATLAVTTHCYC
jgi:hypothetical protein